MTNLRSKAFSKGIASLLFLTVSALTPNMVFAQGQNALLVSKSFNPNVVEENEVSQLIIELINPNNFAATLTANFDDILPAGVLVSGPAFTDCAGVASNNGISQITLAVGAVIPANGSCFITQNVVAATGANYDNAVPANELQTTQGNNLEPLLVTLTVNDVESLLTIGKRFDPPSINFGETSTLTIRLTNTTATPYILAAFNDLLPAGLISTGNGTVNNVGAGTGCTGILSGSPTNVVLTAGTIPANGACDYVIPVVATRSGNIINTLDEATALAGTAPVTADDPASATLTVVPPVLSPTVLKAFIPNDVECGNSTLVITLINPTDVPAVLTSPLVDNLPRALVTVGAATNTCGGIVSAAGSRITLQSGTIPANGSCEIRVRVGSNCNATFVNRIVAGALQTNIGPNLLPATAHVRFCCLNGSLAEAREECTNENTTDEEEDGMSLLFQ